MKSVFVLMHVYEYGENDEFDEIRSLGIYSTRKNANEAIKRYYALAPFNSYPISCFEITEQPLDKDYSWAEGFMSAEETERYQAENNIGRGPETKKSIYREND